MGKEEKEKEEKEQKPKQKSHMGRGLLHILQHIALGVAALSVLIVASGSNVCVDGFRQHLDYSMLAQDQNGAYEESEMFNSILGYAAADIIRYGVVSSQLETDGRFDGSKVVDVTAYNYRDIGLPEQYVTAEYSLEDLLKWSNYGFEWSATDMTEAQAEKFLADKTRVTVIDPESKYYNTSDASYLKSDIKSYTFVNDVSANRLVAGTDDYDGFVDGYNSEIRVITENASESTDGMEAYEIVVADERYASEEDSGVSVYNILVNRYKTAEGKNLEEYVSDWDVYYDLCHNVQNAAKSLAYNYTEYLEYEDYYSPGNSNLHYLIEKTIADNVQIYTNIEDEQELESVEMFMALYDGSDQEMPDGSGQYIYYSPADMVYLTNTAIAEDTIRNILQGYDYAYPENVKIWINVDTSYQIDDAFKQGSVGFRTYMPSFWQWIATAVVMSVVYLFLLCYLTIVTGREIDEEGRRSVQLKPFDYVPTEAALMIAVGFAILALWLVIVVVEVTNLNPNDILSASEGGIVFQQWFRTLLFLGVFMADSVAMFFFYSLVRRIKAGTLWKNSYLRKIVRGVGKLVWTAYDNGHIVVRTWVPYGLFLIFNLLGVTFAVALADAAEDFIGVVVLVIVLAVDILIGNLIYRNAKEQQDIVEGIKTIAGGQLEHQVATDNLHGDNLTLAYSVNSIGKGIKEAVEISMKDERMKADLITNVSHDIKTPLTSIINYVDLIKREHVEDEKIQGYIQVLDEKSQRLKQLTDDLVEASKISSGNISLHFEKINLTELMNQTIGEFSEKFEQKNLTTVMNVNAQNVVIEADSRRIWRVIENLFNNIFKYAMEGTRVYVTIADRPGDQEDIEISIKNISSSPLNCNPEELTERFIRGDESRTTEGSGLGLSIAKNLTLAQKGTFEIQLDGDLFKVILTFPLAKI